MPRNKFVRESHDGYVRVVSLLRLAVSPVMGEFLSPRAPLNVRRRRCRRRRVKIMGARMAASADLFHG